MTAYPESTPVCRCGCREIQCPECLAWYCRAPGHLSANHVCADPRQMEFGDEPAPCLLHGDAADWEGLK